MEIIITKTHTPIKAIRLKCIDCMCCQKKEITLCPVTQCPLWPYRRGKRPRTAKDQIKNVELKKSA